MLVKEERKRLERKLNVTVPIAIINMVIKKKRDKEYLVDRTWVGHAISKHATH
jgi:hypothetical protein